MPDAWRATLTLVTGLRRASEPSRSNAPMATDVAAEEW
jgi:hypothetical protein